MTTPYNSTPRDSVVEGDPFGTQRTERRDTVPTATEVNRFHTKSDRDSSALAIHHTLGVGHNQAASGDHVHDGKGSSRKVGYGLNLTVTGSKAGNVALANLITMLKNVIEFTDSTT